MAESIVNSVLGKLAGVVVKEVSYQHGIDQQVEIVRHKLDRIHDFLKDADRKKITDDYQKHWLKEVTVVAYSIEDVLDNFLLEVSQKPQSSRMKDTLMSRVIKKTKKKNPSVDKLVVEIKQIETKLNEIEAYRIRYGINNLSEDCGPIRLPVRPPVQPDIDPDIVGFEADRDYLVKKLIDETTKRRTVIPIWGLGGLGKTTLAQKVYNCIEVKQLFEVRIWLTMSQKFELIDVINETVRQLSATTMHSEEKEHNVTTMHSVQLGLAKIHFSLRKKKYLIVLDDVWTIDLWIQIHEAFPDENNGSRVLITSRSFRVGLGICPLSEPYKLATLPEKLSRELLLKSAFPNLDPNKDSFDDLSNILDQFIHKCDGLPLALVVLGGLLSSRRRNNTAWSDLFREMSWHDEGRNCSEIMATSYEDLPFALKSCFIYFAAFPKDYNIHAPSLIQMWIAEDFIPKVDNETLEETAESFLNDLIQRSLVQFVHRSKDYSIKYIRIHSLLLDIAINKAEEGNFLVVCSRPDDERILTARRVAIHNLDCTDVELNQNLRSLLCFGNGCMPNCSKQRLLQVVTADCYDTKIDLGMFKELPHLRYLNLNWDARGYM